MDSRFNDILQSMPLLLGPKYKQGTLSQPHNITWFQVGRTSPDRLAIDKCLSTEIHQVIVIVCSIDFHVLIDDMWVIETNFVLRVASDIARQFIQCKT